MEEKVIKKVKNDMKDNIAEITKELEKKGYIIERTVSMFTDELWIGKDGKVMKINIRGLYNSPPEYFINLVEKGMRNI